MTETSHRAEIIKAMPQFWHCLFVVFFVLRFSYDGYFKKQKSDKSNADNGGRAQYYYRRYLVIIALNSAVKSGGTVVP